MTPLQTLAFFRSAIISGEPWTDTCQQAYTEARGVLASASETEAALVEALMQIVALDGYRGGPTEFAKGREAGYRNCVLIARAALSAHAGVQEQQA